MIKEITDKFNTLEIYEMRSLEDKYCELVFYSKDIKNWNKVLTEILNPAVKPAGTAPSEDALNLTKDYGGIHDNQILYKKEFDNGIVIAMIWPWQDGTHSTLKLALLEK